jgi:hypothetical protein
LWLGGLEKKWSVVESEVIFAGSTKFVVDEVKNGFVGEDNGD